VTAKQTPQKNADIGENDNDNDNDNDNGERSVNRVTFAQVVALEAVIIIALWFLGRMFS
jgi:hypothetical protein